MINTNEVSDKKIRIGQIADKMETEALYIEQQIILLDRLIEDLKAIEDQGASSETRQKIEVLMNSMKQDLKFLDESLKSPFFKI